MGQSALLFATAALLSCVSGAVLAQDIPQPPVRTAAPNRSATTEEAINRVVGYTAWDDGYFYLAIQVNKPTIVGTNEAPFSHPLDDDAVLISIQTDDDHKASRRTAHTVTVAISAAGGMQLYSGASAKPLYTSLEGDFNKRLEDILKNEKDEAVKQKKQLALLSTIVKVQVVKKGIARLDGGNAPGYTLEVAIPWVDLGGKPAAGTKMGLNIAAQSKAAGSPELQSLAAGVKTAKDLDNPSLWGEILFSNAPAPSTEGALVCPRVFTAKPEISGELASGEWNSLSVFSFGEKPDRTVGGVTLKTRMARSRPDYTPNPARPIVPLLPASVKPLTVTPHQPQQITPLVMARYEYWYQADSRKAAPVEGVGRPDQTTILAHHPLEGSGPWFSYDRADWHMRQLSEARKAGVDVVLPVYRGAPYNRQRYADKGLTVLAAALQSLQQTGQDYPQVALFLDTASLAEILGEKPDLREEKAKAALYGIVRDFYRRIPAVFRCVVPLTAQNGGRRAYPVFLSSAAPLKEFDSSFVAYLRGRFLRDFGADLVVLGEGGFRPKAALDGYFMRADKGFQFDNSGWIKVASVGPGSAGIFLSDTVKGVSERPRRYGASYRSDWTAALARHPDLVFLDSWNDFTNGAEIAPSLEEGYSTTDLTKLYTHLFAGSAKFGAKYLWHDAPRFMLPGQNYKIHLRVQNTGQTGWGSSGGLVPVSITYQWKQDGNVVASGVAAAALTSVISGQNVTLTLPIAASTSQGAALTEGDYTLEVGLVGTGKKGGDEAENHRLQLPIRIPAAGGGNVPQWAATLIQTDLPVMLETGSVYPVEAAIRNDGALTWRKADRVRVTLRLYRTVPTGGADNTAISETPLASADASAVLDQDIAPGQEANVHLLLPLLDGQGSPLLAWNQEDLWTYTARWEVAAEGARGGIRPAVDEENPDKVEGVSFGALAIAVTEFDFGVRFTVDRTPASLPGDRDKPLPVLISLQNVGPQTWKRDQVRVGYHWYYLDGTELRWEDATTPIPVDVPPGGSIKEMRVSITPPPLDGTYYLVWDVKFGDTWASTAASTRVFDSSVRTIQVFGGRLRFADLTKAFNLDGITDSGETALGDFDGQGRSFPAALLPPYADAPAAPSSLWLPSALTGPESPRRISFRWGPKEGKAPNFIVCKGQRLELGKSAGPCHVLHLLAASTGKNTLESFRLIFQELTSQSEDQYALTISRWDQPPSHGEEVAFLARNHYERDGLKPGAVALYHYTITIKDPRKLVAILLPNAPDIKIGALTLEK